MKHWRDCNCTGAVFVEHVINHLRVGEEVICKICGKTVAEIAAESSQPAVQADAQKPCPLCEMMMRPDHSFNYCFQCGRDLRTA